MLKRIVEKNGKFYLVKGIIIRKWWDWREEFWWLNSYQKYATAFNSKEELREAYKRSKAKFRGFL